MDLVQNLAPSVYHKRSLWFRSPTSFFICKTLATSASKFVWTIKKNSSKRAPSFLSSFLLNLFLLTGFRQCLNLKWCTSALIVTLYIHITQGSVPSNIKKQRDCSGGEGEVQRLVCKAFYSASMLGQDRRPSSQCHYSHFHGWIPKLISRTK